MFVPILLSASGLFPCLQEALFVTLPPQEKSAKSPARPSAALPTKSKAGAGAAWCPKPPARSPKSWMKSACSVGKITSNESMKSRDSGGKSKSALTSPPCERSSSSCHSSDANSDADSEVANGESDESSGLDDDPSVGPDSESPVSSVKIFVALSHSSPLTFDQAVAAVNAGMALLA